MIKYLRALVVIFLLILVAIPTSVWASHQFSDVPDSSVHHDSIAAAKGAGITAGCTATTFCPQDPVTRGQMATFLGRSLPRVDRAVGSVTVPLGPVKVAQVTVTAPGTSGGALQFVKVDASYQLAHDAETGCPCEAAFWLYQPDAVEQTTDLAESVDNSVSEDRSSGSVSWVFQIPAGATRTYQLWAARTDQSSGGLTATGLLTAITAPYGASGGATFD